MKVTMAWPFNAIYYNKCLYNVFKFVWLIVNVASRLYAVSCRLTENSHHLISGQHIADHVCRPGL